jgi:23S rRNA (cytosine1962-C5)-methyltransferase
MACNKDSESSSTSKQSNDSEPLAKQIKKAIQNRKSLIERLHKENTDAYRIFHGTVEGRPGLTIDRYGLQAMVQTFHQGLAQGELDIIEGCLKAWLGFDPRMVYHDRSSRNGSAMQMMHGNDHTRGECKEMGMRYTIRDFHRGQDPLLFLDLRAARRYILGVSKDTSVLNLFAYTCGVGICAAAGGAKDVVNVDFSSSNLNFGRENARLNGISDTVMSFVKEDVFPVIRQFAGIPVKGRGGRRSYVKLRPRQFDIVVIDPPRWAKSAFGAVDLVRDYQSIFKPALLATAPGGKILCSNHVPEVELNDWLDILVRCAAKAGRPLKDIEIIKPEEDFPSLEGRHALKIAVVHL